MESRYIVLQWLILGQDIVLQKKLSILYNSVSVELNRLLTCRFGGFKLTSLCVYCTESFICP